ncbi:MAG: single-stranded DNA-binding protein [Gemmatimonadales bacterium]
MAIHTQESLSGFIASDPQLTYTAKGDARLYARVGKEHFRKEQDGSFTQLESSFHDMVMFGRSAERAHAQLAKGDKFVAEGYVRTDTYERDGQTVEGEEFVAKKIGHDTARTRYDVDRTPRRAAVEQAPAERDATAFTAPDQQHPAPSASALGM